MASKESHRIVMGESLKNFRNERGLSAYKVAQLGGIRIEQVQAVEAGTTNYTIDAFLGYIRGCNLYMYFADKGDTPSLDDMARKAGYK